MNSFAASPQKECPLARASLVALLVALLSACSERATEHEESSPPADDGSAFLDRARVIHEGALVLDAHADIEIPGSPSRYAGPDGESRVAPEKMQVGGVDAVVMAVAVGPGPRTPDGYAAARRTADEEIAAVVALAEDPANNVVIPLTADDLVAGRTAIASRSFSLPRLTPARSSRSTGARASPNGSTT